jgi:acyl dehydratase
MEITAPTIPDGLRLSTLNLVKVLHGGQKIELHRPLPAQGSFTFASQIVAVVDKGADKGALVIHEMTWTDDEGIRVATLTNTTYARGDGGFGGPTEGGPEVHQMPARPPDRSVDIATRLDQAVLYRLSGDYNPLHVDPDVATAAGFSRPILHGQCTYGITCRAVLQTLLNYDTDAILSHEVRFSSPVYPGDVITVDLWRDGKIISFEARVKERNVTVIRNGKCVLR